MHKVFTQLKAKWKQSQIPNFYKGWKKNIFPKKVEKCLTAMWEKVQSYYSQGSEN